MPRTMTSAAIQELLKVDSGEPCLFLFTFENSDWSGPVRLVNNPVEFISNANTFGPCDIVVVLPREDTSRMTPKTKIVLNNVGLTMTKLLRATSGDISLRIELVIASLPNDPIYNAKFLLSGITFDEKTIEGTILWNNALEEQIPCRSYNPEHYPGLFGD